ncbi:RIC1-domain-containing protein [Limtongia smithiae]|uniref:RIC1-domain-containing protein n=1 Tax=Limtongia smithiae TaxID=1125753 RepID=UPI0034CE1A00
MYWPVSTPRVFSLPRLESATDGGSSPSYDNTPQQNPIIAIRGAHLGGYIAAVTKNALYVFQIRPFVPVTATVRTESSLESHGPNIDLMIRPDGQIIIVQTEHGHFITYSFQHGAERVARFTFDNALAPPFVLPGPGEENGVMEHSIRFRMVIKVDAGIESAIALEDELLVLTSSPPAAQFIRWVADARDGSQTRTELLTHMDWFKNREKITYATFERAMGLYGWISSSGNCWAVLNRTAASTFSSITSSSSTPASQTDKSSKTFSGYCFHVAAPGKQSGESGFATQLAINPRFSLIIVGTKGGHVHIYNVRDYKGHIPLLRTIKLPFTFFGDVTSVAWSPDGYAVFVGYKGGWAVYSVYGKLEAHSVLSEDDKSPREPWLQGIKDVLWTSNGGEIILVPYSSSNLWTMEFKKWSLSGNYNAGNLMRTLLFTNERLLLYHGQDQSDLTTISHEAILWQEIPIPYNYLTANWPIQQAAISPDGRYIAVAGKRGFAHYGVYSGRWRFVFTDQNEDDASVSGGMLWYDNILIAGIVTNRNSHEIRAYSRDRDLDDLFVLHVEQIPSPIILISLVGDSLLVYTYSNVVYQFVIYSNAYQFTLQLVGQVSFNGIVHAPARVRAINWILPEEQAKNGNPVDDMSFATIIFLVDGKLVVLYPAPSKKDSPDLKYDLKILDQNVEYFVIITSGLLKNSIWAFDGADVLIWLELKFSPSASSKPDGMLEPIRIPVDFYPLSFLMDKGIMIGLESNLIQRRNAHISYLMNSTRTSLFIHRLLRYYLASGNEAEALKIAKSFSHLEYFGHALEMMLHDVLDAEADNAPPPETALLPVIIKFLQYFPEMLDVIVGCTRKTEMASWHVLFAVAGNPKDLFEKCMTQGRLKTAGGYLLILHTMEQLDDSFSDVVRLFSAAMTQNDWDLCKELARFLTALDNSGRTLRESLSNVELENGWVDGMFKKYLSLRDAKDEEGEDGKILEASDGEESHMNWGAGSGRNGQSTGA